ncbi:tudor domain-containing protein [Streptacidiphilus carbonis]|uniref:tudor domain-containing protein n=1 Tax=Streptacidiphilus carbonis TaxID=105422 RepID=UPI0005A8D31B|nr:tudor domain-containing protein [Streptacidiphilus carbonis]
MTRENPSAGEEVVVHRESAERAAERGTVVGVRRDGRLRVRFADGHCGTCDARDVASLRAA